MEYRTFLLLSVLFTLSASLNYEYYTYQYGSSGDDLPTGSLLHIRILLVGVVATDNGKVWVTGHSNGGLFGANVGGFDVFVALFYNGTFQHSQIFGSVDSDLARGIAYTATIDRIYICGTTNGSLFATKSAQDAFIVALNGNNLTTVWSSQLSATTNATLARLAVTESEPLAVYAVGTTTDTVFLGKNSNGGADILVLKFNADNGNIIWVQLLGGANQDRGDDLAIDLLTNEISILGTINLNSGDLYIAKCRPSDGLFYGYIQLDQGVDYSVSLAVNPGNGSLWMAGQTQSCLVLWGFGPTLSWDFRKPYCGVSGVSVGSSIMYRNNLLYVVGVSTDSSWNGTSNHGSVSTGDIIFSTFSVTGNLIDVVLLGTPAQEVTPPGAFWMDNNANPKGYIVGSTSGNYGGYNQGGLDMFLTVATPCSPCVSPTPTPTLSPSPSASSSAAPSQSATTGAGDQKSSSFTSSTAFYAIIGAGGGGLLLIIAVVILAVLLVRKRRKEETHKKRNNERSAPPDASYSDVQLDNYSPHNSYSPHGSPSGYGPLRNSASQSNIPLALLPDNSSRNTFDSSASKGHDWIINYTELKKIGQGAFGEVFKGTWRGIPVAIKRVILPEGSENADVKIQDFFAEAELMKSLRPHPNITQLLGVVSDPLCIVTEYVVNGSLDRWLRSDKPMDDTRKIKIARGIAAGNRESYEINPSGMHHLHSEGVIHRDLAARNILLDKTLAPKVSDFGMSRVVFNKQTQKTDATVGPVRWMAPEALTQFVYNTKTDVWSFGCVVYELITRKPPYSQYNVMQVGTNVSQGKLSLVPEIEENEASYPAALVMLLKACLRFDPQERPDFEMLIDWLDHTNEDNNESSFFGSTKK